MKESKPTKKYLTALARRFFCTILPAIHPRHHPKVEIRPDIKWLSGAGKVDIASNPNGRLTATVTLRDRDPRHLLHELGHVLLADSLYASKFMCFYRDIPRVERNTTLNEIRGMTRQLRDVFLAAYPTLAERKEEYRVELVAIAFLDALK